MIHFYGSTASLSMTLKARMQRFASCDARLVWRELSSAIVLKQHFFEDIGYWMIRGMYLSIYLSIYLCVCACIDVIQKDI